MRFLAIPFCFVALAACSGDDEGATKDTSGGGVEVQGKAEMFPGFAYDTGLLPSSGPAQVSLAFKTKGETRVVASGARREGGLDGKAGSGKVAIELHAKLDGRLKVDVPVNKYDGPLPKLDDIDIAAVGEASFDPFLLEARQSAEAVADVRETKLPSIPLGSVPGSLELTVKKGSVVRAKVHGTCLRGAGGSASFMTETLTSGKLVLGAVLKLDLPPPLNKEIALPEIAVDLPETKGKLEAKGEAAGLSDFAEGACASDDEGTSSSSSSSGSSGSSTGPGGDAGTNPDDTTDGGEEEPNYRIIADDRRHLTGVGGAGGDPFTLSCRSDEVVTGIHVGAGDRIDRIALLCSRLRSDGSLIPTSSTGTMGGSGGGSFSSRCPSNEVVVQLFGRAGVELDAIGIGCAPLGAWIDPTAPSGGKVMQMPPYGGYGGTVFTEACPRGYVLTNTTGRAKARVDAVRGICTRVAR